MTTEPKLVTEYGITEAGLKLHRFNGRTPESSIGRSACGFWIGSLWYSENDGPGRERCGRCFPPPKTP